MRLWLKMKKDLDLTILSSGRMDRFYISLMCNLGIIPVFDRILCASVRDAEGCDTTSIMDNSGNEESLVCHVAVCQSAKVTDS